MPDLTTQPVRAFVCRSGLQDAGLRCSADAMPPFRYPSLLTSVNLRTQSAGTTGLIRSEASLLRALPSCLRNWWRLSLSPLRSTFTALLACAGY